MEKYLVLENASFVVLLFGALTFGGMSWLYFDATIVKKQVNVWLSAIGSLIIAFGFIITIMGFDFDEIVRYLGYFVLGLGVWLKPMSARPDGDRGAKSESSDLGDIKKEVVMAEVEKVEGFSVEELGDIKRDAVNKRKNIVEKKEIKSKKKKMGAWWVMVSGNAITWLLPILPGWVGLGYFRLATVGMERHLIKLGVGMYFLLCFEILNLRRYFVNWSDPRVYILASDYGLLWMTAMVVLFLGLLVISVWVFSYLLKRFETQLTLFLCIMTIFAFAVATIGFTYTTASSIESRYIEYQKTTLELLRFSEERRAQEMILRGKDLGGRSAISTLFELGDAELAKTEITKLQEHGELTGLWVVSNSGSPLLSLTSGVVSDWSVYAMAVKGEEAWGYELESGVVSLAVAVPVKSDDGKQLGVVVLSKKIDSNYLQEISNKVASGLWVYKQDQVVSYADNKSRVRLIVGQTDKNSDFSEEVLVNGKDLVRTSVSMMGEQYMGVWSALKNTNGSPIGSLAVVSRVDDLWVIVRESLKKDYQLAVLSLIFSLFPAVLISRYFARQLV